MNILLIEDDHSIAAFEKRIFKEHTVVHVTNLHDAITEKMNLAINKAAAVFDLVILDLVLPTHSMPNEYRTPKEVLETIDKNFKNVPVVVISAFVDQDMLKLIAEYNMVSVDKTMLEDTDAFRYSLFSFAEFCKKMRSASLTQHLTVDAVKLATKETEKLSTIETSKQRADARLYLMAGTIVILTPWFIIGYTMLTKEPLPYYTETLAFCGLCIAVILGVAPWLFRFLGKEKS